MRNAVKLQTNWTAARTHAAPGVSAPPGLPVRAAFERRRITRHPTNRMLGLGRQPCADELQIMSTAAPDVIVCSQNQLVGCDFRLQAGSRVRIALRRPLFRVFWNGAALLAVSQFEFSLLTGRLRQRFMDEQLLGARVRRAWSLRRYSKADDIPRADSATIWVEWSPDGLYALAAQSAGTTAPTHHERERRC